MDAGQIENALDLLGDEIAILELPRSLRITVVGGTYMLFNVNNREITKDVDVIFIDIQDHRSIEYKVFTIARELVATRLSLPKNWINDVIGDFLKDSTRIPAGKLWKTFGNGTLEVYMPDAEYILALKVLAGRPKDRADALALIQKLGIKSIQDLQEIVDRYIPNKLLQQQHRVDVNIKAIWIRL